MPIVTWNRDLPYEADWTFFNQALGQGILRGRETYHVGSQTTTSFRSSPENKVRYTKGFKRPSSTSDFVRGQAQREADYNQMSGPELLGNLRNENRQINGDIGNEFYTKKKEYTFPHHVRAGYFPPSSDHAYVWYEGAITNTLNVAQDSSLPSHDKIVTDGTACVRATIPTSQQAVLGQFLLELRERLPHLYGTTLLRSGVGAREIGDEYLNSKFGIDPLVSDVKKIGHSILNFNKLIKDFQKKSGTNVHRRLTLYNESSVPYPSIIGIPSSGVYMSRPNNTELLPQLSGYFGLCDVTYTQQLRCEFSGAYTYYLDQGHSYLGKLEYWSELADYLLGTKLNASTVWELTPWSWLADWFSNTGTFLSNVTLMNQDDLVMRYGYVMHTCTTITSINTFGIQPKDPSYWGPGYYVPSAFTTQVTVSEKRRTRATPYGFGVDLGSLSPQRWAILSALGLTKSPTTLRRRS